MKFDLKLQHNCQILKFPYLHIQAWDADVISANDIIAETIIDIKGPLTKVCAYITTSARIRKNKYALTPTRAPAYIHVHFCTFAHLRSLSGKQRWKCSKTPLSQMMKIYRQTRTIATMTKVEWRRFRCDLPMCLRACECSVCDCTCVCACVRRPAHTSECGARILVYPKVAKLTEALQFHGT